MANELKTVTDIRDMLTEEITRLRNGDTTPAAVNAIVNATGKVLSTVKMEIDYNKLVGRMPEIPFIKSGQKSLPTK